MLMLVAANVLYLQDKNVMFGADDSMQMITVKMQAAHVKTSVNSS